MEKQGIYLITRNKGKLLAARGVFAEAGIELKQIDKAYPEIQAENSLEIAKFTALQAAREFNAPCIREDHSFFIKALGSLPGPYTSYFDKRIPAKLILDIMKNVKDRSAYFEVVAVYAKPDGAFKSFSFTVPAEIAKDLRGDRGNWDKMIILKEKNRTIAETKEEDNLSIWNKNYLAIAKEISEKKI